jgi:hypothetical protein
MSLRQSQMVHTTEKVNFCLNDGECIIGLIMCSNCTEFHGFKLEKPEVKYTTWED